MDLKNTKTAENLRKALAGESIARNKYTYFAQAARLCSDAKAAEAFEQMAKNEMMHAKFWFEQLYGRPEDVQACLTQAAQGEYSEWHGAKSPVEAAAEKSVPKQKKEGYRCQFCGAVFADRPDVCDTCGAIGAFEYTVYYE